MKEFIPVQSISDISNYMLFISNRLVVIGDWVINLSTKESEKLTSITKVNLANKSSNLCKIEATANGTYRIDDIPIIPTRIQEQVNSQSLPLKIYIKVIINEHELHSQWGNTRSKISHTVYINNNLDYIGKNVFIGRDGYAHSIKIIRDKITKRNTSLANKYLGKSPNELGRSNWNELRADFIEELNQLTLK